MNEPVRIRPYRPGDETGAFHVCLKTGDHGADGEPFYKEDPDALARIYVDPYFRLDPDLALVAEDEKGICGYVLGTMDSRRFFQRYETEIRPAMAAAFPRPTGPIADWSRLEEAYHLYHEPDYFCPEPYEAYPSHLHIDLLPRAQGCGLGRRLIESLIGLMEKAGTPGVHLGMSIQNDRALGFYEKLGFVELVRDDEVIYLGRKLQA